MSETDAYSGGADCNVPGDWNVLAHSNEKRLF